MNSKTKKPVRKATKTQAKGAPKKKVSIQPLVPKRSAKKPAKKEPKIERNEFGVLKNGVLTEFTVDRSKWHRGKGADRSRLVVSDPENKGEMCCVGFLARACGISERVLMGVPMLGDFRGLPDLEKLRDKLPKALRLNKRGDIDDSPLVDKGVYRTNDVVSLGYDRERRLKKAFKELGITIKFVGETNAPNASKRDRKKTAGKSAKGSTAKGR